MYELISGYRKLNSSNIIRKVYVSMKFDAKLQKLRREKGMSQEALAEMLDVSRQAISKWESGQSYPEMEKLIILTSDI